MNDSYILCVYIFVNNIGKGSPCIFICNLSPYIFIGNLSLNFFIGNMSPYILYWQSVTVYFYWQSVPTCFFLARCPHIFLGSLGNKYIYGGSWLSNITLVLFLPFLSLHLGFFSLYRTRFLVFSINITPVVIFLLIYHTYC